MSDLGANPPDFPSLDKEGWREAPGWFDKRKTHHPAGFRRHPSSVRRGR